MGPGAKRSLDLDTQPQVQRPAALFTHGITHLLLRPAGRFHRPEPLPKDLDQHGPGVADTGEDAKHRCCRQPPKTARIPRNHQAAGNDGGQHCGLGSNGSSRELSWRPAGDGPAPCNQAGESSADAGLGCEHGLSRAHLRRSPSTNGPKCLDAVLGRDE